jgi:hypothetical protein
MINIQPKKAIILASEEVIGSAFAKAFKLFGQKLITTNLKSSTRDSSAEVYASYSKRCNLNKLSELDRNTFDRLVESVTTRSAGIECSEVLDFFLLGVTSKFSRKLNEVVKRLVRLTLKKLWLEGLVVLPKDISCSKIGDPLFIDFVTNSRNNFLIKVVSVNQSSGLDFKGGVAEEFRKICANHWLRLLLNTDWISCEKISEEDIRELIENGSGSQHSPLSRYYVNDFLSYLFNDNGELLTRYQSILAVETRQRAAKREVAKEIKKAVINKQKCEMPSKMESDADALVSFSLGDSDKSLDELMLETMGSQMIRKNFYQEKLEISNHLTYSRLDERGQELVKLIDLSFKAFIVSKSLQKTADHEFILGVFLSYVSVYLPSYYNKLDGNTEGIPTTFNEFGCAYFIVQNEHITQILSGGRPAPITLFKYIELLGEVLDWDWNKTTYARLIIIRDYCEYIERHALVLPDTDKFRSTISKNDMPKTKRGHTTVKNVIPREYFKTFICLLETYEYMVEHINGMAEGVNGGLVDGQLVFPTYYELCESRTWSSLWGKTGSISTPELNLDRLNYTPIIYHEGKCYPLKHVMRFYGLTPYKVKGDLVQRITPHAPRLLLLMANTGIRQQHLIWLDKDSYDSALSNRKSALAPLVVSTDKSHSEWVSIVTRNVIEICDRQREWLESNEISSIKVPMWYGGTRKSAFGQFIPLFRLDASPSTWAIYDQFPKVLWTLQRFLREQVGDGECPDLAYWKPSNKKVTPGKLSDHRMTIEEFSKKGVDLSWKWKLNSIYTPHGLRASFITDCMRFLPPDFIGRHLTGQFSEALVWYYNVMNTDDIADHRQLLLNLMKRNHEDIGKGFAPQMAQKIGEINASLAKDIADDPGLAIAKHRLFSLSDIEDDKNGIATLRAKKHTILAHNGTHICPFNNTCPSEIIQNFGADKPCTLCPFAIRGDVHLPAIEAEKFKCLEMMKDCEVKIKTYKGRPKTSVIKGDLKELESHYDRLSRDAAVLEALEAQLFHMREINDNSFIVQDKDSITKLYKKIKGDDEVSYLFKRLIDVQCFPDMDSPGLQRKFALLRHKLMLATNDLSGIIESHEEPEHVLLASQLHSLMSVKGLSIKDIYRIASTDNAKAMTQLPILKKLGLEDFKNVSETAEEVAK